MYNIVQYYSIENIFNLVKISLSYVIILKDGKKLRHVSREGKVNLNINEIDLKRNSYENMAKFYPSVASRMIVKRRLVFESQEFNLPAFYITTIADPEGSSL